MGIGLPVAGMSLRVERFHPAKIASEQHFPDDKG